MSEEQVLVAAVHDVRPLATVLRGLGFCPDATVFISEAGLTVSVEQARMLLARAYIPLSLFDEFKYTPELEDLSASQGVDADGEVTTTFEISLETLLECLNIFGTATSLLNHVPSEKRRKKKWKQDSDGSDEGQGRSRGRRGGAPKDNATIDQFFLSGGETKTKMHMSFVGAGHPLILRLAEDAAGPTTTCEIETMINEGPMDLPFDDSRKIIKIILRSSWLREALSELDPSCDKLTFIATPPSDALSHDSSNPQKPIVKSPLRLSAEGTFGSTQMDYPNDRDVLETFECAVTVKFTYRVAHITCALRALHSSIKTSLRIDDEGLLSLQLMMAGGLGAFIEFRCLPLDDDI